MKALILRDNIIQVADQEFEVHPDYVWFDCPEDCTTSWVYANGSFTNPLNAEPSNEEKIRAFKELIKNLLMTKVAERQYESDLSCASYASSSNVQWKAEADAFIAWRDGVYSSAYIILNDVLNGAPTPSDEDFLASLPELVWPPIV